MNILLISIDSLRIDYVLYQFADTHTRFDALTRDFCFYNGLFSASTATRPVIHLYLQVYIHLSTA